MFFQRGNSIKDEWQEENGQMANICFDFSSADENYNDVFAFINAYYKDATGTEKLHFQCSVKER